MQFLDFKGLAQANSNDKHLIVMIGQVAFDKLGVVSTQNISKQREKEQPAVMAELERQVQRSLTHGDNESASNDIRRQTF